MPEKGTARPSSPQTTRWRRPSDPPTFDAFRTSDGVQLAFMCNWCERLHYHGAIGPKTGEGNGHRAAHCDDRASPYITSGYIVRETSRVYWVMA